jgi:hypothetical protein
MHAKYFFPRVRCEQIQQHNITWQKFVMDRKRTELNFTSHRILRQLASKYEDKSLGTGTSRDLLKELKREKSRQGASLTLQTGMQNFVNSVHDAIKETWSAPQHSEGSEGDDEECVTPEETFQSLARSLHWYNEHAFVICHRHCSKFNYFYKYPYFNPEFVKTDVIVFCEDGTCVGLRLLIEDASVEGKTEMAIFLSFVPKSGFDCLLNGHCKTGCNKAKPRFLKHGQRERELWPNEVTLFSLRTDKDEVFFDPAAFNRLGTLLSLPMTPYYLTKLLMSLLTVKDCMETLENYFGGPNFDSNKVWI